MLFHCNKSLNYVSVLSGYIVVYVSLHVLYSYVDRVILIKRTVVECEVMNVVSTYTRTDQKIPHRSRFPSEVSSPFRKVIPLDLLKKSE